MLGGACRYLLLVVALACAWALAGSAAAAEGHPARAVAAADRLEAEVLAEVNALRARRGLARLRLSSRLAAAADQHSRQMALCGFFGHNSADGSPFWKRVERFYPSRGYGYWSVGENLIWASPDIDAADAVRRWLKSPPHRRNLLATRWREIGLSAVHVLAAPGAFNGLEVTIVTADFGVRR